MYKLKFFLRVYAGPLYRRLAFAALAVAVAAGVAVAVGWGGPAAVVLACLGLASAAVVGTVAVSVGNVLAAAWLNQVIARFEEAYNRYRKGNHIPDPFYEEMDLEEAAVAANREG